MKVSRRDALTKLAAGGVGAVLAPAIIRGQSSPIIVAGRPVEILVRPLGEFTVRISLRPIVDGKPQPVINRGALAEPVGGNESRVETGDMVVSVVEGATTTITVRRRGRIVQTLSLSRDESTIAFAIGNGPIFGLGEGGPQFDRRGTQYPSRNGQGGYQLRTHGGRVPIQWLVSTDGWGMYIHQPLGSFDLMGSIGRLMPTSETIVGINGSMVNGTPVIRPARGEAPSIPPWDSADFPRRTARRVEPARGAEEASLFSRDLAGGLFLLPTFLLRVPPRTRRPYLGHRPSTGVDSAPSPAGDRFRGNPVPPGEEPGPGAQSAFELPLVMKVIPAIDLRQGSAVRLVRGEKGSETRYGSEPEAMVALHWESEGASMLHVVDLDAAFGETRRSAPRREDRPPGRDPRCRWEAGSGRSRTFSLSERREPRASSSAPLPPRTPRSSPGPSTRMGPRGRRAWT